MQGYIFLILQHFATKLCNFTNFRTLFNAVVINFPTSTFFKILSIMQSVHCYLIFCLAAAVFEFAMFGIMVLFLSFCGFFTFKHCFYIWRRKKRRRHDDSLESILDLLYNEDYYYLESSTPYLPPQEDDSSSEKTGGSVETEGETSTASYASAPTQGQSVKWDGTEKISMNKYKVKK